ncbi:MAG TPA: glycosyltransferase [Chloroflexia bacterium]|nr:glycosyltransferase [Chloroflexia bacterium]
MKLLFLSPFLPSPPRSGGPRRIHGLLAELARRHEVSVLAFTAPGEDVEAGVRATREYAAEVVTVENDRLDRALEWRRKRTIQLRSLFRLQSYERLTYHQPAFQRAVDRMAARGEYDVVTTEFAQMTGYRLPRSARLVLDEHNIEYDILRRTASAERLSVRKLYSWANYLKLRREERAAWGQFDGITLTSDRDERLLRRYAPEARTAVIPNGVDTEYFRPGPGPAEPGSILFFGAINYYPNTEGLLFFLDEVFPRVKREHPGARLWIVGQQPPPAITERAAEDVIVAGLVDDVRPYLERAAVVIAPLRIGGGTRLKIVEAMAMGKPVVATRIGAEGLDLAHGEDILLADTADVFAGQVSRVLGDEALARRLGEAARQSAVSRYSWRGAAERLERFYEQLPHPSASRRVPSSRRREANAADSG